MFLREKEKVEAKIPKSPQQAPLLSLKQQQQATESLYKEQNIHTRIHMQNLKVGTSTLSASCWLNKAHLPKPLHLGAVFTEALLHMALNCTGPKAAYGQDINPLWLEEEAESVACLACSDVGQTEAARGQESGAGAACWQKAMAFECIHHNWLIVVL